MKIVRDLKNGTTKFELAAEHSSIQASIKGFLSLLSKEILKEIFAQKLSKYRFLPLLNAESVMAEFISVNYNAYHWSFIFFDRPISDDNHIVYKASGIGRFDLPEYMAQYEESLGGVIWGFSFTADELFNLDADKLKPLILEYINAYK